MTGILGGSWVLDHFHPMGDIPTAVKLTSYSGEAADITPAQLKKLFPIYMQKILNCLNTSLKRNINYIMQSIIEKTHEINELNFNIATS